MSLTEGRSVTVSHILIVEDDPDICFALESLLRLEGFNIVTCANGRAALQALEGGKLPDLIVLDLAMPIMDGMKFLEHKKVNPLYRQIPTIVLSANLDSLKPTGVVDTVIKPLNPDRFIEIVKKHLCAAPSGFSSQEQA